MATTLILGTVISTLYPPPSSPFSPSAPPPPLPATTPATHVSIVALASTAARLLTGTLSDLLAPAPGSAHPQVAAAAVAAQVPGKKRGFSVSRVVFLLVFAALLSAGFVALASGLAQGRGDRFWVVSGLAGAGYGAVFSVTPTMIAVIWGVENFATNWGIVAMCPAVGATLWGVIYSAVYQAGASHGGGGGGGGPVNVPGSGPPDGPGGDIFCYGKQCYAPTFWAMAASVWVACLLIIWAWKGPNGWSRRGIVV